MEPPRKYRIIATGNAKKDSNDEERRDSTYIHNLEELVIAQTQTISDLNKDVTQMKTAIEDIRKLLIEQKTGDLDKNTYYSFPITNKDDLASIDELLDDPTMRANITSYVRKLKFPGDLDFNLPLQQLFSDEFISNYNVKGTHGKEDLNSLRMFQVLQDAWTNEYVGIKEFQKYVTKAFHMGRNRYQKRVNNSKNSTI